MNKKSENGQKWSQFTKFSGNVFTCPILSNSQLELIMC